MIDISIFMPCIRVHLLPGWYESLLSSVGDYSFEAVICGPFDPPKEIAKIPHIKFIKSYAHPTKCAQIAAKSCAAKYLYHTVDDVVFLPNRIKEAMDLIKDSDDTTIIGMRYKEGANFSGRRIPEHEWTVGGSYSYLPLPRDWYIYGHFLMNRGFFRLLGGFDCAFEYLNHATHDLEIRAQIYGMNWIRFEEEISSADWVEGTTGDHAPIHYAQTTHDAPLFNEIWGPKPNRTIINIDNDKNYPDVWERRFPNGLPKTYEEMQS